VSARTASTHKNPTKIKEAPPKKTEVKLKRKNLRIVYDDSENEIMRH
jgi:hypothetical protein